MPLVSGLTGKPVEQADYQRSHDFGEMLWGGFKQENTLISLANWYAKSRQNNPNKDFSYDPFENLDGYEEESFDFIDAQSDFDVDQIKRRIDDERDTRRMLDEGGGGGLAARMIGGFLDPLILLPIGGAALKGTSLLHSLTIGARTGLVGMGLTESVLQATQTERTLTESSLAVASGALFAGILGPIHIRGVKPKARSKSLAQIEKDLRIPEVGEVDQWMFHQAKVSADDIKQATGFRAQAPVERLTFDDLESGLMLREQGLEPAEGAGGGGGGVIGPDDLLGEGEFTPIPWTKKGPSRIQEQIKNTYGVGEKLAFLVPGMRLSMQARAVSSRRLYQALAESPLFYEKNALAAKGETTQAAETFLKMENVRLGRNINLLDNAYFTYRTGLEAPGTFQTRAKLAAIQARDVASNAGEILPNAIKNRKLSDADMQALTKPDAHTLSKREFNEAVSYQLDHPKFDAPIPEVQKAAIRIREDFFDHYGKRMKDAKLAEGIDLQSNYLTRVYNREIIGARTDEFAILIRGWMKQRHPELSEAEIRDAVEEFAETVMGQPQGHAYSGRVFDVPNDYVGDNGIRLAEFLERDISVIMEIYHRSVVPKVILNETFGDHTLKPHIQKIRDEYQMMRRDVLDSNKQRKNETPAAYNSRIEGIKESIRDQMTNDVRDIEAIRDILLGTYRAVDGSDGWVRVGKFVRRFNVVRQGGGFMVSSVPDLARPVMIHGFQRTFKNGLEIFANNREAFNLLAADAGKAGFSMEMTLGTRGKTLADIGDPYGRLSRMERGLEAATNTFFMINLLSPWNHAMKHFSGVVSTSRIMDAAEVVAKGGALDARTLEHMNFLGLSPKRLKTIWKQFETHGEIIDGKHKLPKADDWADQVAAKQIRAAVLKDVDNIIVTPGAGDKPLAMNTELGRVVGQYKSFSFASTQKMLLSSLQRRDMAVMNGIALSAALGMGVYIFKEKSRGRTPDYSPGKLAWEGIDRSGLIGIISDFNNTIEVATRGQLGVSRITGGGISSRYSQRGAVGNIVGPSVGLLEDLFKITGTLATGDVRQSDIRAIRRLIPYQNLFYARNLFDWAERGAGAALGAQGR